MNLYTLQELQIEWDKLRNDIQKESEAEFNDQKNIEMLSGLLSKCIDAGQYITEPGKRANLQWIAREIGDTIFRIAKEYPDIVISSSLTNIEKLACSEMQNVYSVKENVNSLNRDSLFLQGSKPVNIETSYPNNLNNSRTGTTKFVGREKVLSILHEQLRATEHVSITSVTGMGGIGKTELALQYAHFHLKEKTYTGGICWLDCRDKNVGFQITSFATSQFNLQIPKEEDIQTKIDFCWHNWAKGDVLIIFDDVVNYEDIANYLPPPEPRFKVLITTRKIWLTQSFQRLELVVLDEYSALELLISCVGNSRIELELQEAKELCKDLGFLPLGLELVARYLERKPSLSLVEVRKTLGLEDKSLERFSKDMTAQRGVVAAFELSWNELDEDSKALGCLLSLFASAPIPWNLVEKCLLKDESQEKGIIQKLFPTFFRLWLLCMPRKAANVLDLNTWKHKRDDKLINFSLLQYLGGSNYGLHPLIRQYFKNKFAGFCSLVEEMKYSICKVIAESAREIPYAITVQQVSEVEVYIPHIVEVAENLHEFLSDDDLILPFVRLGWFYQGQGLYSQAQPWFEKGKKVAEQRFREEHPHVATSLNNLARLYESQGRYEEAEPLCIQALDMHKKLLGEEHPSVAQSLNNLGLLYCSQGRYEEAEPLYIRALEMRKKLLGYEHHDVASSLNNLGLLYCSQGRYEEAEPLYIQALDMGNKLLGEEHRYVAQSLNNLGLLYCSQGRYEEAEPLYIQALDMGNKLLGKEHISVASSLNNLALLYYSQGRYEEAEPLYIRALDLGNKLFGEEHPSVATSLNNLAGLYKSQGRYEEAEPLYIQSLEMSNKLLGEEHPSVASSLNNLAGLYESQGRYEEAEPLYIQSLEMSNKLLGEEHPSVAFSLHNLALLYESQGRYEEAEPLYIRALEMRKKLLGNEHHHTQETHRGYQALLEGKKRLR
jgi:tetratricopeptide (TPR) repeat protein